MSRTIYVQPIFAPDKCRFERNIESLKSMSQYILDNKLDLNVVFGGWCANEKFHSDIKNFCNKDNFPGFSGFFDFKRNYGKATVVNELLKKAKEKNISFDFILSADSDILFDKNEPNMIGRLEEFADISKKLRNLPFGLVALNQKAHCCHLNFIYQNTICYKSKFGLDEKIVFSNSGGGIAGGCIFVSKVAWETVGGYRVMGVYAGDDGYLLLDLINKGFSVQVFDSLSVIHPHDHDQEYALWKRKVCHRDSGKIKNDINSQISEADEFWRKRND